MSDDVIEFASLMCSRLCHDLLSPVGSFGNGLELLAEEQDAEMRQRCMTLLEASATAAINRLKFFRLAFGSSGGYGDSIAVADITDAISGLVPGTRQVTLNWLGAAAPVPKPAARVLLTLALVVVDALVRGGRIDMAMEQRGDMLELALRGAGDRVVVDEATRNFFAIEDQALTPRTVPIALARRLARGGGGDVMLSLPADGEIVVGALLRL